MDAHETRQMTLPATPAELIRHLIDDHGWSIGGYDSSLVGSHRYAHGADIHPDLRTAMDHDHPFTRAFRRGWKRR